MKVVYKEVGKAPQVKEIENTLEALQKAVGGYIEVIGMGGDILMVCDEEGKLKNSPYNFKLGNDFIVGNVLFVQSYGEDFTDISDANAELVLKFFDKNPYQA